MALKIELKPNERLLLGDCVLTNSNQRTSFLIEGSIPVLREKDIMSLSQANTLAKRIYLAVQFMYAAKQPQEDYALYAQLVHEMLKAAPGTRAHIDSINECILSGDLYKALKKVRKLMAYEEEHFGIKDAPERKTVKKMVGSRQLEASLLLKAAAKLQSVHDSRREKPSDLYDALHYNRRLWTVFIDAVSWPENKLALPTRGNLKKLGMRVIDETNGLMTDPKPSQLASLIKINRAIAAGLSATKLDGTQPILSAVG